MGVPDQMFDSSWQSVLSMTLPFSVTLNLHDSSKDTILSSPATVFRLSENTDVEGCWAEASFACTASSKTRKGTTTLTFLMMAFSTTWATHICARAFHGTRELSLAILLVVQTPLRAFH